MRRPRKPLVASTALGVTQIGGHKARRYAIEKAVCRGRREHLPPKKFAKVERTLRNGWNYLHTAHNQSYWRRPVSSLRTQTWMPDQVRHDNIGTTKEPTRHCRSRWGTRSDNMFGEQLESRNPQGGSNLRLRQYDKTATRRQVAGPKTDPPYIDPPSSCDVRRLTHRLRVHAIP